MIRLRPGTYSITTQYPGNNLYKPTQTENTAKILQPTKQIPTKIISKDLTQTYGENKGYIITLKDQNNNKLTNQNIKITIAGKTYDKLTDENGTAKLMIRLRPGTYPITTQYPGNNLYKTTSINNIATVLDVVYISKEYDNNQIQQTLNGLEKKTTVKFVGTVYNDISLNINNPLILTSGNNCTLNGKLNKNVITLESNDTDISNLNIIANNSTGVLVKNSKNVKVLNNFILNILDKTKLNEYQKGKILMPGNGISLINSQNTMINNNKVSNFYNGIYLEKSSKTINSYNNISKNNYGITISSNVNDTEISNNTIVKNIGLITMEEVEGPLGYGIYLKDSGVNVKVIDNKINDNYIGLFINSKNSSGIVITSNEISENVLEGITFNVNYTFAENSPKLIVENNAIYNNAKGPGMIVLGEVSANPAGIYGPGEFNDSLKLVLGTNWYGTNKYTTWGNESKGAGTICPRIHTTLITFNLTTISPGKYEVIFYKNGEIASNLPDFNIYFTLNFKTINEEEVKVNVEKGKGIFSFKKENYKTSGNIIEGSSGSLNDKNIIYHVISTYNLPDNEIPK